MAPDNTRRALLAVGEQLRALDRQAVLGARIGDAAPPAQPAEFARRIDALDDWLERRVPARAPGMRMAAAAPAAGLLKGIDVYAGTGRIDWARVKEAGIAFAYVRAAYGVDADKAVQANLDGARAAGIPCGVYHFLRTKVSYDKQVDVMLGLIDTLQIGRGDLPPAVDVEDNPFYDGAWNPANNAAYLAAVERWVDAVRTRTGADPVLYTRAGFWDELGNPKMFRTCPLWVASYRPNAPRLPATWDRYTFWQYSEAGEVDGIASKVDLNYFAGGKDALDALLLGARTAAPARAQARRRQERRPPPSA